MKPQQKNQSNAKNSKAGWYFLIIVILIYLPFYFIFAEKTTLALNYFTKLLFKILPIFLLVYIIMLLTNYFINNNFLKKIMGKEAGIKGWAIAIITGIISAGPIYMWYPLMKDLQKKGVKNKFLATFLYNRGIKLQWLPILVVYFGWLYSITLLLVMAVLSIPQGVITEKMIDKCCQKI